MKRTIFFTAVLTIFVFGSCSNDDDSGTVIQESIETRAAALGFPDVKSYQLSVGEQCAVGNHENCDIQTNGTHLVCGYAGHSGTKHDGTHHNGTAHGTHDSNGNHNCNPSGQHH